MNIRVAIFALVALAIVGLPAYAFLDEKMSGGVRKNGDYLEVNLKTMTSFPLDQEFGTTTGIPLQWRNLDGKKVILTGQIFTGNTAESAIPCFELVYSVGRCCQFGAPQQRQHFVYARLPAGRAVGYSSSFVRVFGTLHVGVEHDNGRVSRVFTLDVEKVDPLN